MVKADVIRAKFLVFVSLLVLILLAILVRPVEGASDSFVGGRHEFYIVKEVIEVTSDWQDIIWIQGPTVYAIRHQIVEGADAVENLVVTGLTVWVTQKSLETVKVVLEIEALVLKGDETVKVRIEKGAIGYANVELMVYDVSVGSFSKVTEFSTDRMYREFEFDITSLYEKPAGELVLEETLKELKGKVLSFYYPWYTSPHGPSGRWVGWEQVTEYSIHNSANYPLHGAYDSNDENVIRSHMAIAKQAGIDGFIVSWWGIRSYEEKPVDKILELAEQMDLNITFYYESVRDLTKDDIVRELTYLFESYAGHPAFLRVSGKHVVFVYAVPVYDREQEFWLDVRNRVEENVGPVVLIGDTDLEEYLHVFDGFHRYIYLEEDMPDFYRDCVDKLEVGVSSMEIDDLFSAVYSDEEIEMRVKPFLLTVTPGFDTTSWGEYEPYIDRLDGETYTKYWNMVREIEPHSVLITSWNEWGEGTEIEPSREYGFKYISITRSFIEEYKGTLVPEPEVAYSAAVESFKQHGNLTGVGEILINVEGPPAVYVNVSIRGGAGVTSLDFDVDYYTYVKRQRDEYASIIIPSIPSHEELDVRVIYKADVFKPLFNISVTAFDPSGRFYELYKGKLRPVVMSSITGSLSLESMEMGESITVSGILYPENEGRTITLSYTRPDSLTLTRTAVTDIDGSYSDTFEPDVAGSWSVRASWEGDVEFEGSTSSVVHFTVTKIPSSFFIQTPESRISVGESITISGSINPAVSGAEVVIAFTKPDGSTFTRTVSTGSDGAYTDLHTPTETGSWSVKSSWDGDSTYIGATSQAASFTVEEKPRGGIPGFPYESIILGLLVGVLAIWMIQRTHRCTLNKTRQPFSLLLFCKLK